MKKTLAAIAAIAAIAASCSKSEVTYETPGEIGFNVVAGNVTKTVVDGNVYPTTLNMYVFAQTTANTEAGADYIANGEFANKTVTGISKSVWGGTPNAYYWPNVNKLHFAGYSKSGNIGAASGAATATYDCSKNPETLTITNYTPGNVATEGANDLMWFPTTELNTPGGYGSDTEYVAVDMYHTCAWITFLVKGDSVTGAGDNAYKVTALTMDGIDLTADVVCSAATNTDGTVTPTCTWSKNTDQTGDNVSYSVPVSSDGVALSTSGLDVETGSATLGGNIVVIPQKPGKLTLTYSYTSPAGKTITETKGNIDLALTTSAEGTTQGPENWEAGKHYIYTITIKANEILIAPTPVDWTDSNWNITVE